MEQGNKPWLEMLCHWLTMTRCLAMMVSVTDDKFSRDGSECACYLLSRGQGLLDHRWFYWQRLKVSTSWSDGDYPCVQHHWDETMVFINND